VGGWIAAGKRPNNRAIPRAPRYTAVLAAGSPANRGSWLRPSGRAESVARASVTTQDGVDKPLRSWQSQAHGLLNYPKGVDGLLPSGLADNVSHLPDPIEPVVYIVDDDVDVRTAIQHLLRSVDIKSEIFASADAFLAKFDPQRLACVVLDVRMPQMSGLELQRVLAERGADPPMILITAHAEIGVVVRAMKAGAVQVFGKPFDHQEFIDAVQQALDQAARRREEREHVQALQQRYDTLTSREREVMALVVAGKSNKRAAADLGTTEKTVKAQRARVMDKMAASSLPDLVRMADRLSAAHPSLKVGVIGYGTKGHSSKVHGPMD
jgi:FixJ family two-component response regulator